MWKLALVLALCGCISKAKEAISGPEPEGGGTLTCKQLVEDCDSQCSDPLCLHRCSPQGLPEARKQHDALLECGERASCTDEDCMRTNCPTELAACVGPEEPQGYIFKQARELAGYRSVVPSRDGRGLQCDRGGELLRGVSGAATHAGGAG